MKKIYMWLSCYNSKNLYYIYLCLGRLDYIGLDRSCYIEDGQINNRLQ